MKRPCTIDGIYYESVSAATRDLKISISTLRGRLHSPNFPEYISKHCPKKPPARPKNRRYPHTNYPCTIDGIHYESELAAAKAFGLYTSGLRRRLTSPNFPEYVSKYRPKRKCGVMFVSCSVAGVEYRSIGNAARELGIHYDEMERRLASPNYPDYICAKRPKGLPRKWYIANGKKYRTMREIAKLEGVTAEAIRLRMNNPKYPEYQTL